jgi:hypothetical protein
MMVDKMAVMMEHLLVVMKVSKANLMVELMVVNLVNLMVELMVSLKVVMLVVLAD